MKVRRGSVLLTLIRVQMDLSAADLETLCIHPTVVFGEQRRDHGSNVFRQARTPKRSRIGDHLVHCRIVTDDAAAEICLNRSWRHGVDCDSTRPQRLCETSCENFERSFKEAVRRTFGNDDASQTG